MQNLVRFYRSSDFDREYLWNESKYPKSERQLSENDSCRVRERSQVNFGPLTTK